MKHTAFITGLIIAATSFGLDRWSKYWVEFIFNLGDKGVVKVMPFLNFVLHKNTGVSFSFFNSGGETGRWILVALTCVITLGLTIWLKRTNSRLLMVGIGLVIGGAVGNIYDRATVGAVTDFIQFYWGDWSFAIFNLADSSIFLGAALLIWDSIFDKEKNECDDKNDNS